MTFLRKVAITVAITFLGKVAVVVAITKKNVANTTLIVVHIRVAFSCKKKKKKKNLINVYQSIKIGMSKHSCHF